jgi:hypothetical protein
VTFLIVETIGLTRLYVLFVIRMHRQRVHLAAITANPPAHEGWRGYVTLGLDVLFMMDTGRSIAPHGDAAGDGSEVVSHREGLWADPARGDWLPGSFSASS